MLNEDQGVIDLPTEKASRMHPSQTDAEITGWGCANDAKMDFSPTAFRKQRTVVEVFNQTECHARWPSLEVTSKNILCTDSTAMDGKVCNLVSLIRSSYVKIYQSIEKGVKCFRNQSYMKCFNKTQLINDSTVPLHSSLVCGPRFLKFVRSLFAFFIFQIEDSGVFFETYWSSEERQNKHRILGLFVGNSRYR